MAEVVQLADHAALLKRDREAFRMLLDGELDRDIAEALGCTVEEVHAAQHRMCGGVTPEFKARVVEKDLARLDAMHKFYFEKALAGDKEAAALVIRFMDRRAKYCGLDVLPGAAAATDDRREPSSFERIREAIFSVARGPVIEGEVVKDDTGE